MKAIRTLLATVATLLLLGCSASAQQIPTVTLNNGAVMPLFGIGTYNQTNDQAYAGVLYALQHGYRHIDTAHAYGDEEGVGRAIKDSGVPREELWVTSKLWMNDYGDGKTLEHIDEMLARLGLEYLDLLYIHQPFGDLEACWKDMEKAVELGKVRTLGISNFDRDPSLIDKFATQMKIKPAILQLESHPYRQAHGKSPVQVILRWHIQDGRSAIPGSKTPAHVDENIDIFDFELTPEDMQKIRGINKEDPFFKMPGQAVRQMSENSSVVPDFSR